MANGTNFFSIWELVYGNIVSLVKVVNFALDDWFYQSGAILKPVTMECQRQEIKYAKFPRSFSGFPNGIHTLLSPYLSTLEEVHMAT